MPINLAELRAKRNNFLVTVYELANGEVMTPVNTRQVAERMGIDYHGEASSVGRYWRGLGYIDWKSFDGIWLTILGHAEAERILEAREREEVKYTDEANKIDCPNCHNHINATAKYCEHCGVSLSKLNATTLVAVDDDSTLINPELLIGKVLDGKYEILTQLGKGGGGTVYRAKRVLIGDEVALKVLLNKHLAEPSFRERFRREATAAAKIRHPNVVQIYDFSEGDGTSLAYLVMELVDGVSLAELLKQEGRLQPTRAIRLTREICNGIGAAHKGGVLHRDLKPSNVIILPPSSESATESLKIVDFGLAKFRDGYDGPGGPVITQVGQVVGTPSYMSPEQCKGEDCDARSDVYSLGVILYELIAGELPFSGTNAIDIIGQHLHVPPAELGPRFDIAPELEAVLMRALAKDPKERQANAAILSADLKGVVKAQELYETTSEISPAPTLQITQATLASERGIPGLEETDAFVFKTACDKAIALGNLNLIMVPQLVFDLQATINQDEVMDSLEILTRRGYIEPTEQRGCGLRICTFNIGVFGFEQYLTTYVPDYEAKRESVLIDIVRLQKDEFEKPDLITEHILDMLADEGLIETAKTFGGITVMHVSAELRRNYDKQSKATKDTNNAEWRELLTTRAAKLAQGIRYKEQREEWRNSKKGREDADLEVAVLFNELLTRAKELTDNGLEIQTQPQLGSPPASRECKLIWRGLSLHAFWIRGSNTKNLNGSRLKMELGELSDAGYVDDDKSVKLYTPIRAEDYEPSLAQDGEIGWVEIGGSKQVLLSSKVAEIWIHFFVERIEKSAA